MKLALAWSSVKQMEEVDSLSETFRLWVEYKIKHHSDATVSVI